MSATMKITKSVSGGGLTFSENKTINADGNVSIEKSLGAAFASTGWTKTDNDTGTITGPNGHTIATGNKISVYWAGGSRRNVTVGTVSGNSIPVDLGSGDNYPASATALTFMLESSETFRIDGSSVVGLAISCEAKGTVILQSTGPTEEFAAIFREAGVYVWHSDMADANPITGDTLLTVALSHGDSTQSRKVKITALYN